LFKPGAVATGFQSYDYFTGKLTVKTTYVVFAVVEFVQMDFPIGDNTVSNGLYSRMKVYSAIYCRCHGRLLTAVLIALVAILLSRRGGADFIPSKNRKDAKIGNDAKDRKENPEQWEKISG